jgi:hypothetical protein
MTITLSPEIELVLTEEAARQGTTPEQTLENALRIQFSLPVGQVGPWGEELRAWMNTPRPAEPELSAEEKESRRQEALARVRSGYYVDRLSSSEEHSARKAEEKAMEERRWRK